MIEKALVDLLSSLSQTELVSLFIVIGGVVYATITGTLKFTKFVKDTAKEDDSHKAPVAKMECVQERQEMRALFDSLGEKVSALKTSIDAADCQTKIFDLEKKLSYELSMIHDKLNKAGAENDKRFDTILTHTIELKPSFDKLSEHLKDLEEAINRAVSEDKITHQELMRQIQSISKDLASLQGTIIGNMSVMNRSNLR